VRTTVPHQLPVDTDKSVRQPTPQGTLRERYECAALNPDRNPPQVRGNPRVPKDFHKTDERLPTPHKCARHNPTRQPTRVCGPKRPPLPRGSQGLRPAPMTLSLPLRDTPKGTARPGQGKGPGKPAVTLTLLAQPNSNSRKGPCSTAPGLPPRSTGHSSLRPVKPGCPEGSRQWAGRRHQRLSHSAHSTARRGDRQADESADRATAVECRTGSGERTTRQRRGCRTRPVETKPAKAKASDRLTHRTQLLYRVCDSQEPHPKPYRHPTACALQTAPSLHGHTTDQPHQSRRSSSSCKPSEDRD
jgi:hypothetical protein